MEAAKSKTVARAPAPAPAPAAHPVRAAVPPGRVQLQSALKVSSPGDAAEKEAESTARRIVRMPRPAEPAAGPRPLQSPHVARFGAVGPAVQRKAEGQPNVAANVAAEISASTASGSPLPASVRRFMEPRFRTDFGNVRVHTNERAARLNRQLNAQAFTVGNQIFFGRGRFRPETADGQELLAHELTHTIQQGAAVQRAAEVPVTQQSSQQVQRLGLSDALDYFADKANLIPGFRMFTIILGVNPINMSRVERSAANILRAVIEMIPGGVLISQALENNGVFARAGAWVEQQINTLGMTGSLIRDAIDRFLDSLSWTDIFDLGGVWDRAKRIFTDPIDRILSFIGGLVSGLISLIKDAILRPLARLAQGTRGYDLLKAVLGQDPITGDPVPRNAETLIGGFMHLIGQDEIWQNIQRANAIARAWAWFQGALSGLWSFVQQIPSLFVQAFRSLEIADIILVPRAFQKIAAVFGGFIGRFLSWAGETVWSLLEIIFSVVAPNVMVYLRRAAAAFRTILRNPIGFVGNLVRAGILGLRQFATNFLTHLRASLIGWLTGAMSGANIYIPQAFNLREILKFVLSVLGLTWQNIRQKLVRVIGETAVRVLETGFDIVMTLVTQGPAAAWEKIQESLSNLRDMVMEQVMTFVRERIVQAAITRLVTGLNPAGAFIQAIIAIYNTVMFFIERLRQIAQVAMSFIDSISAIASGVLTAAANRVEQTMAGLLTLVISFLARIVGLGRVSDAVTGVIERVRQPIDRALDRVVEWIVEQARRLGRLIARGARAVVSRVREWWRVRREFRTADGEGHSVYFQGQGAGARLFVASDPKSVEEVLRDDTLNIPNRDALRTRLAQLQGRIAGAAVTTYNDPQQQERAQDELQRHVESEVLWFAGQLAQYLGHVADLPPTAVTYQTGDGGRPMLVRAEPMTVNPGNTTGSEAGTSRDHLVGISLVSKWEQKTGEHTREGHENPTLRSRVTGAHILAAAFHGPFTQPWNVVLTDQALNNRMTRGPEAEAKKHYRTTKLSYTVRVSYYTNDPPPPQAHTVKTAEVDDVKKWVGYYIGTSLQVTVKKWKNNSYSETVWDQPVTAGLPPVQGERIPPLDEQIIEILKAHLVPNETYTDPDDPERIVFVKTSYSGLDVLDEVRGDESKINKKVRELKEQKKLYGRQGRGARIYIRRDLL